MKKAIVTVLLTLSASLLSISSHAGCIGYGCTCQVEGYIKSNGTVVQPYQRHMPGLSHQNNLDIISS